MRSWFWLIAGPNGVGKTTYAMRYLRAALGTIHFVSLDEIARGLSPLEPRAAGLSFGLLDFAVPDVETCLARVARRVVEGGHDVPAADVRRRFVRSAASFSFYAAAGERWRLLDDRGPRPVCVAEGADRRAEFIDEERLAALPAALAAVRDWGVLSP